MSRYEVVYVGDNDLPDGQRWALVRTCVETYLFIKERDVCAELLSEIWRSWQHVDGSREPRRVTLLR